MLQNGQTACLPGSDCVEQWAEHQMRGRTLKVPELVVASDSLHTGSLKKPVGFK
jgi:hypothetical protein